MIDIDLDIYKEHRSFSGEEACKLILWHWHQQPEQCPLHDIKELDNLNYMNIWNYSGTGELSYVFIWWDEAIKYYRKTIG